MTREYALAKLDFLRAQVCPPGGRIVKSVPGVGPGRVDPDVLFCLREKARIDPPPPPTGDELTDTRASMGFPNLNLNTRQVLTRFEKVPVAARDVGVWRYCLRHSVDRARPALVFIHGGAWIGGDTDTAENPLKLIAQLADAVVFNVDYSLAPESPYPVALEQCLAVVRHVREHSSDYGIDPSRIAVGGDSAGGNLAAALALRDRDDGTGVVARQVLVYPAVLVGSATAPGCDWVDLTGRMDPEDVPGTEWYLAIGNPVTDAAAADLYPGAATPVTSPYVSPMLADSLAALPPALVVTAEWDGLRVQGEAYAERLAASGVQVRRIRYAGCTHAFFDHLGYVAQTEDLCREIAQEIARS
jgi:acetyl esterase/lipase